MGQAGDISKTAKPNESEKAEKANASSPSAPPIDTKLRKEESSYHHGDLREALIQAGLLILREQGIQKLSLREAARTAGVSQAAPYRHFENKEALIAAIAQEGFSLLGQRVHEAAFTHRIGAEERFHQIALAYLQIALSHTDHFRLMFAGTPPLSPEKYPDLDRSTQSLFGEFVGVIDQCQRERIVRNGNVEQLALIAWSSIHGFASLVVNRSLGFLAIPSSQVELAMRSHIRNLLDGLKPA
jgi:AcrR family transcriptional regulator